MTLTPEKFDKAIIKLHKEMKEKSGGGYWVTYLPPDEYARINKMARDLKYKILEESNVEDLQLQINKHIQLGWVLDSSPIPFTRLIWDDELKESVMDSTLIVVMWKTAP